MADREFSRTGPARRLGRRSRRGGLRILRAGDKSHRLGRRLHADRPLVLCQRLRQCAVVAVRGAAAVADRGRQVHAGLPAGAGFRLCHRRQLECGRPRRHRQQDAAVEGRVRPRASRAEFPRDHLGQDTGRGAVSAQSGVPDSDAVQHPVLPRVRRRRHRRGRAARLSRRHQQARHARRGGRQQQPDGGIPHHPVARRGSRRIHRRRAGNPVARSARARGLGPRQQAGHDRGSYRQPPRPGLCGVAGDPRQRGAQRLDRRAGA